MSNIPRNKPRNAGNSPAQRGIIDSAINAVTANKYGSEHHAFSLDPNHLGAGYNFVGPGTNLQTREKLGDNIPINSLDSAAKAHDYAYMKEDNDYLRDNNKAKHMQNIWSADKQFMHDSFLNKDDPVVGTMAAGMIGMKMLGEKTGLLSTQKFSGIRDFNPNMQSSDMTLNHMPAPVAQERIKQRTNSSSMTQTKSKGAAMLRGNKGKKDELFMDK